MPKPPKPPVKQSATDRDANRSRSFQLRVRKTSEVVRRQQLSPAVALSAVPARGGVKLAVNVTGNLRGMNNSDDSEHMKRVRAMRRFYNRQMPVLQCANCAFASSCPQFKAGYECAFLPFLNSHKIDSEGDLIAYMKELLGANIRRAHLNTIMETLGGGVPSLETSEALNLCFMQLAKLHELTSSQVSVSAELDSEGTIIGRLFGNLGSLIEDTKQSVATPIEVEVRPARGDSTPAPSPAEEVGVIPDRPRGVNADLMSDFSRALVTQRDGSQMESVSVSNLTPSHP